MKIPHIKLEIRILFHWLHLSGKLCHQVREGKRLGLVEIIIFSSTISQGTVSMSLSGVECDPVDIYFSLVPPLTGLATTIFLIVSNHDQLIAPQCGKCWSGHGYIIFF